MTMDSKTSDSPGVIAFPPLLFLLTLLIGIGAHLCCPISLTPRRPLQLAGAAIMLAAGGLALLAMREMRKSGTNINPTKPATAIVHAGPYRITRNPMYLALCMQNLGIGLLMCDLVPIALTAVLAIVLHFGVILREERYLEGKFGEVYLSYRRQVRRWI
jgi:protein-S-isoprenylcysteine O-methyltransferase Ste14